MIGFTAILGALIVARIAWPLFRADTTARLVFLTVSLALAYWYWLPAANILTIGYLGPDTVVPDPLVARDAAWTVLAYQVAATVALAGLATLFPERPAAPVGLGGMVLASAGTFLIWTYRNEGPELWLRLLAGQTSARELMDYYNFSTSIEQSLRALLEVATVFGALIVLARSSLERRLWCLASVLAAMAIMLVVAATGTRSPLLMAIVVAVLGRYGGQARPPAPKTNRRGRLALSAVAAAAIPVAMVISIRAAKTGMGNPVLSMVLVNNDMFRELVYVKSQMADFRQGNPIDFLMVPFTYMLPGFLGFARQIPEHLLAFNGARANIDLILGSGNVFPGLIADNVLVFGGAGPVWFGASIVGFTLVLRALRNVARDGASGLAVQVAASAFLFVSFRNVHPGLALILAVSAVGLWGLQAVQERAQLVRQRASRA
jgi:hypothetical protein